MSFQNFSFTQSVFQDMLKYSYRVRSYTSYCIFQVKIFRIISLKYCHLDHCNNELWELEKILNETFLFCSHIQSIFNSVEACKFCFTCWFFLYEQKTSFNYIVCEIIPSMSIYQHALKCKLGKQGWNVPHFLCILFQTWYQGMSFNHVFSLM